MLNGHKDGGLQVLGSQQNEVDGGCKKGEELMNALGPVFDSG
jgi:hypothetical protein